jgi:hypothetical protein
MFNFFKLFILIFLVSGCARHNELYFSAIEQANEAQKEAAAHKFAALQSFANSTDAQTANLAILAIAMTPEAKIIIPQKPQDPILAWAHILVPSLTTLGSSYMSYRQSIETIRTGAESQRDLFKLLESTNSNASSVNQNLLTAIEFNNSTISHVVDESLNLASEAISAISSQEPIILTQPEPIILTQPEPIILTQPEPIILTQP